MYIEKVSLYNNESLGNVVIPLSKNTDLQQIGNEDITVCKNEKDGSNHYSFIIGDNGMGKTSLLNSIANIYFDGRKMSYTNSYTNSSKSRPYIRYVGTGLSSSDNDFNEVKVKVINPNKVSIARQVVGLFCYYSGKVHLLEEKLGKNLSRTITVSINYRTESTSARKYICRVGANNNIATRAILKFLLQSKDYGSYDDYSAIKGKIINLDCYDHLEQRYSDIDRILQSIYDSQIGIIIKDRLSPYPYDPQENYFKSKAKEAKQAMMLPQQLNCDTLSEDEMLMIMLLEELGLLRVSITCKCYGREFPISALSTGEKIMIKLFSIFADITEKRKKNIIFLYDEPENSLHPQWQKEFPELIRSIVEDVYQISGSHFIFATHSPQIIMRSANLPNSFVLRIERDEIGEVVVEPIDDIPTFNYERALLDIFACSYYTKAEIEENRQILQDSMASKSEGSYDNTNKLKLINSSINIFNEIESLYNLVVEESKS